MTPVGLRKIGELKLHGLVEVFFAQKSYLLVDFSVSLLVVHFSRNKS